jgi:hypothetical protein
MKTIDFGFEGGLVGLVGTLTGLGVGGKGASLVGEMVGFVGGTFVGFGEGLGIVGFVGFGVGLKLIVGITVATAVGTNVGTPEGFSVGINIGVNVGSNVGSNVGLKVGVKVGAKVGSNMRSNVGLKVSIVKHNKTFNAAKYLFVSYRLALVYPELAASKIIMTFTTPWPRQSYQHVDDFKNNYDGRFSAVTRSASMVLVFFLTNLLAVPLAIQDMVIQMCSTAVLGYTILLHIQLYEIYPVLVIVPALFLVGILHFFVRSHQKRRELQQRVLLQEYAVVNPESEKLKQRN